MPLFILEVVFLLLILLSLKILHKYSLLTENRFGLIMVAYLSVMTSTAAYLFPTMSTVRVMGLVLSVLCWFPGYPIAKRLYRRIFPYQ